MGVPRRAASGFSISVVLTHVNVRVLLGGPLAPFKAFAPFRDGPSVCLGRSVRFQILGGSFCMDPPGRSTCHVRSFLSGGR